MASPANPVLSRLVDNSGSFNTLNRPPAIPVFLQRSPDAPQGDVRGINGLAFQVQVNGATTQSGTTAADGRIDVRVPPGGTATLQLMFAGAVEAEYEITVDTGALDPVDKVRGQQQRLRMLGYQIGSTGPDGNGVNASADETANALFERSILDFQADQGLLPDAKVGPLTRAALTRRAGG